jgi:hypothetical protein
MRRLIVPLSLVLAVALPSGLAAQSLGEVAAKERERREKARAGKPAPKVITEEDLRSSSKPRGTVSNPAASDSPDASASPVPGAPPVPGASPAASPSPAAAKEKTDEELLAQRQAQWRERMQRTQADVQALSQRVEQIQSKLNDVSGNIYSSSRANLVSEMESTKTLLAQARQTLAELEEEGRRSAFRL